MNREEVSELSNREICEACMAYVVRKRGDLRGRDVTADVQLFQEPGKSIRARVTLRGELP